MKGVFKLFAVIFVCLLSPGVFAQNTGWDGALDRYEKACRILVDYRERMKIGETIPVDSLSSITSQLETLRRDMNRLPGQMTAMQRHRYSAISEMYRNGTPMPSFARIVPIRWAIPPITITNIYGRHDNAKLDYTPRYFLYNAPYYPKSKAPKDDSGDHRLSILADIAPIPDMSFGLMAEYSIGIEKKYGVFIKGRSNFVGDDSAYECLSDGTTEGGYIWTNGNSKVSRFSLSAGMTIKVLPFLSAYAGAGYGSRTLMWEDSEGKSVRVSDRLFKGPAVDAGLLVRPFTKGVAERFVLETGVGFLPDGKYCDWTIGLGWSF